MRILMISPEVYPAYTGGLGIAAAELARAMTRLGHEIVCIAPSGDGGLPIRIDPAVRVVRLPAPDTTGTPAFKHQAQGGTAPFPQQSAAYVRSETASRGSDPAAHAVSAARHAAAGIGAFVHSGAVDLIWAHDWFSVPAAVRARRLTKRPFLFHVHSTETCRNPVLPSRAIREIEEQGCLTADHIVTVSNALRRRLIREFGVPETRITAAPNGLDLDLFAPPAHAPADSEPVVWFVGRLTRQKGPAIFIRAAGFVVEAMPEAKFVVAGDGDLKDDLVRLVRDLGLERCVEFTGWIPHEELPGRLRTAALLAMPGICEPFGLAALEAAACGVPVIITEGAGVTEILPEIRTVPPFSAGLLAREIIALLQDPGERRLLGTRLQEAARRRSWRDAAMELDAIMRRASAAQ